MAISTIWRWETGSVDITALGSTSTSKVSKISFVRWSIMRSLTTNPATLGYRPSHRLSFTVRVRAWFSSWCTMATPFSRASFELLKLISLPSSVMVPASL